MIDKQLDSMLDECFDSVLARGEDVDAVCSRFPGHEIELKQLVALAIQGRAALDVAVPQGALDSTRTTVMEGVKEIARRRELEQDVVAFKPRRRSFGLKSLAWITAAFVLMTSGTALAASGAGPDSFLYPVRQRLEDVQTALSWQARDKAESEVGHANDRLDEIVAMMDEGKPEYISDLLYCFDLHIEKAVNFANEAAADSEDVSDIRTMIREAQERRDELLADINGELSADELEEILAGTNITAIDRGPGSEDDSSADDDDSPEHGGYSSSNGGNRSEVGDSDSNDGGGYLPPSGGSPAPVPDSPSADEAPDSGGEAPGDDDYPDGDDHGDDHGYDHGASLEK